MTYQPFSRVILVEDIADEGLMRGDMGTVVESHPSTEQYSEGYEVEFFAGNGETIAVVSVPVSALRAATRQDVLHVRQSTAA